MLRFLPNAKSFGIILQLKVRTEQAFHYEGYEKIQKEQQQPENIAAFHY